jgi:hypothetical protein
MSVKINSENTFFMSLHTFGRPSIANEFFLKITGDSDPVAAIKRLLNATPPTFETEWLDFKGAANDQDTKKTWSKALAGFANTQGGVLVWGVDARKDQATGIDAAYRLFVILCHACAVGVKYPKPIFCFRQILIRRFLIPFYRLHPICCRAAPIAQTTCEVNKQQTPHPCQLSNTSRFQRQGREALWPDDGVR